MLWADILQHVKPEVRPKDKSRPWLQVDPNVIYPLVLDHFERCQAEGTPTHPATLDRFYLEAAFLPVVAWKLARVPYGKLNDTREMLIHDQALEIARMWLTAAISFAIDGPVGIHILKRPRWKLYV
jgi:hypothetical protein